MEKRLHSSLQTSTELFISSVAKLSLKSAKPTVKSLIHKISPSSEHCASLPNSLHTAISAAITSFKEPESDPTTPLSPPTKRRRTSSRNAKAHQDASATEQTREKEKGCILQKLQVYAYVTQICTTHPKRAFSSEDLLPSVRELHDNLIVFESDSVLLSEISTLCEEWWKKGLDGREMLISQLVPFLVSRTLTLNKKGDVHRVYHVRDALPLFDFEDESTEDLKSLLVRCAISPLYLKTDDGRKFIAFTFGLSPQLLKDVLAMIKSQIPFGRKSVLEAYGEILFRGWKSVEGELKTEIEEGLLQGLVEGAVYASSGTFAASIRRVLGGFINQRTTAGVEELLFRLSEPIIYRSLQVANSNVRQNALHLLLDLFPLDDPSATKELKDTLLEKQVFLLEKLLMDECPDIRVVAVEGCCRILHMFWEIIPSPIITKMLTRIFDDLSRDAASEVRLSTLNGIIYLLGNPQSHEVLKVLLPRFRHTVLDPVLSVRVATLDLLLLLRDIDGFHFNKVVDLNVLLNALAHDDPQVARQITKLLIPSYFPTKVGAEEACNRYLALARRSPKGGARFCEFAVTEGASLKSLLELTKILMKMLLSSSNLNVEQIEGLISAMAFLCESLAADSSIKEALKLLLSSEHLKGLLAVTFKVGAQSSLFNIVSAVSPTGIASVIEECTRVITRCGNLCEDTDKQTQVRSAHKLVLSCGRFGNLFEAMVKHLQDASCRWLDIFKGEIPGKSPQSSTRKKTKLMKMSQKTSGKRAPATFKDEYQNVAGIAWQINDLVSSEIGQKAILNSELLETSFLSLKVISQVSISHCLCYDFIEASPVIAYTNLSLRITIRNITSNDSRTTKKNGLVGSSASISKHSVLDQTIDHLLGCLEPIFKSNEWIKSGSRPFCCKLCADMEKHNPRDRQVRSKSDGADDGGSGGKHTKRLTTMVILLTAIFKFATDAAAVDLLSHNLGRCLGFASSYIHSVISLLKLNPCGKIQLELDEVYGCLKCSFSYGAKLLNLALVNSDERSLAPLEELHALANDLLDLLTAIEQYCGLSYATRIVTMSKQWLPDLVLALGSKTVGRTSYDISNEQKSAGFRSWISVLAKTELSKLRESSSDEDGDETTVTGKFLAFKKLSDLMIPVLTKNHDVLDAVGVVFLSSTMTGLQRKDFGLVLGLLHYLFAELVGEGTKLGKLNMMLSFVQELYPLVERETEELGNDEHVLQEITKARELLQPAWEYACSNRGAL